MPVKRPSACCSSSAAPPWVRFRTARSFFAHLTCKLLLSAQVMVTKLSEGRPAGAGGALAHSVTSATNKGIRTTGMQVISTSSAEQSAGLSEVTAAVRQLDEITQRNSTFPMSLNRYRSLKVHSACPGAYCMSLETMANLKREKQRSHLHRTNLGMVTFLLGLSPQVNRPNLLVLKSPWLRQMLVRRMQKLWQLGPQN